MGKTYRFRAEGVVCEEFEARKNYDDGEWAIFTQVALRAAGPARKQRRGLFLIREWTGAKRPRYVGPINARIADDSRGVLDGVTAAILTRDSFRMTFDDEAAATLRKDEVRVELDLTNEQFAELRRELSAMFSGLGVYREEIA